MLRRKSFRVLRGYFIQILSGKARSFVARLPGMKIFTAHNYFLSAVKAFLKLLLDEFRSPARRSIGSPNISRVFCCSEFAFNGDECPRFSVQHLPLRSQQAAF